MNSDIVHSDWEDRESRVKKGVILTMSPFLSLMILLGPLSHAFPRPSPGPIKAVIGLVLLAGVFVGPVGLQQMSRGRAGRFDGLGLATLALQFAGAFFYFLFLTGALMLWGVVAYGALLFGGR